MNFCIHAFPLKANLYSTALIHSIATWIVCGFFSLPKKKKKTNSPHSFRVVKLQFTTIIQPAAGCTETKISRFYQVLMQQWNVWHHCCTNPRKFQFRNKCNWIYVLFRIKSIGICLLFIVGVGYFPIRRFSQCN